MLVYWEAQSGFDVEKSRRLIEEVASSWIRFERGDGSFGESEHWARSVHFDVTLDPWRTAYAGSSGRFSLSLLDFDSAADTRAWAQSNALHLQFSTYVASWFDVTEPRHENRIAGVRDLSLAASRYQDAAQSLARQLGPTIWSFPRSTPPENWFVAPVAETLYWYQTVARDATPSYRMALKRIAFATLRALRDGVDARFVFHFLRSKRGQPLRTPDFADRASTAAISAVEMLATTLMRHAPPTFALKGSALTRSSADGLESHDRLILHRSSTAWPSRCGGLTLECNGTPRRSDIRRRIVQSQSDSRRARKVSRERVVRQAAGTRQKASRSRLYECRRRNGIRTRVCRADREDRGKRVGTPRVAPNAWRDARTPASTARRVTSGRLLGRTRLREDAPTHQGRDQHRRWNRSRVGCAHGR
jgi:hypothetical protein